MSSKSETCPICQSKFVDPAKVIRVPSRSMGHYECEACGKFALDDFAYGAQLRSDDLSWVKRAAISHAIRSANNANDEEPFVTLEWLDKFLPSARLPPPSEQVTNIVRFIGDAVQGTGEQLGGLPAGLYAAVGSWNPLQTKKLVRELIDRGEIVGKARPDANMPTGGGFIFVDLTLDGWERYEREKRGRFAGSYGFVAQKFGDAILDPFMRDHVKPAIKAQIAYDLIDIRDAAKVGIIDNLMREKIRDAAFVLVDLTHENSGAYWEAGYAEGMGKPVLYICERAKFEAAKTHFDTNHLTTVLWEADKPREFIEQLIATLRRSLNLFPAS